MISQGGVPPLQAQSQTITTSNLMMCVDADTFRRIAELYPKTMEDLKERALERREFWLAHYRKSERERKIYGLPATLRQMQDDTEAVQRAPE